MRYPNMANRAVYWTEVLGRVLALAVFAAACWVFANAVAGV